MKTKSKIKIAELNLQRMLDWIARHDNKTSFVTGLNIALIGVLTTSGANIDYWSLCISGLFILTLLFWLSSLFFNYKSQYPQTKSQNKSLIYFGTIANLKVEDFKKQAMAVNNQDYLDDLLYQIHINAEILKKKFKSLRMSLILLGLGVLPFIIFISLKFNSKWPF